MYSPWSCKELNMTEQLSLTQVNMADEAKLHSSVHSTFKALLCNMWSGIVNGEELSPLC